MIKLKLQNEFKKDFKKECKIQIVKCDDKEIEKYLSGIKNQKIYNEIIGVDFRIDLTEYEKEKISIKIKRKKDIVNVQFESTSEVFKKILKREIEDLERKKEREGKSKKEIYNMVLAEAKKTGKKQFLYSYNRRSSETQSNIELVNVYLNAEGKEIEEVLQAY